MNFIVSTQESFGSHLIKNEANNEPQCSQCGKPLPKPSHSQPEFSTIKLGDIFTSFISSSTQPSTPSPPPPNNNNQNNNDSCPTCASLVKQNEDESIGAKMEPDSSSNYYTIPPSSHYEKTTENYAPTVHSSNHLPISVVQVLPNGTSVSLPCVVPYTNETLRSQIEEHSELIIIKPPNLEPSGIIPKKKGRKKKEGGGNENVISSKKAKNGGVVQKRGKGKKKELEDFLKSIKEVDKVVRVPVVLGQWSCFLCNKNFKSEESVKRHEELSHSQVARYTCSGCSAKFTYRGALNEHIALHHPPLSSYNCPICSKKFKEQSNLSAHYTLVHAQNPRVHKCELCPSAFSKKVNLNYHRKRKHGETLTLPKSGKSAGESTPTKKPMEYSHHNQYETTSGGGGGSSIDSVIDSIASSNFILPNEMSMSGSHVEINSQTQDGSRTQGEFTCTYCGRSFQFRNNLKCHLRTHIRDKKYTCETCSKSFIYKESLKNHMLLHSNELPYQCDICGKKFRDRSNRRKHVKNVHKFHFTNGGGGGSGVSGGSTSSLSQEGQIVGPKQRRTRRPNVKKSGTPGDKIPTSLSPLGTASSQGSGFEIVEYKPETYSEGGGGGVIYPTPGDGSYYGEYGGQSSVTSSSVDNNLSYVSLLTSTSHPPPPSSISPHQATYETTLQVKNEESSYHSHPLEANYWGGGGGYVEEEQQHMGHMPLNGPQVYGNSVPGHIPPPGTNGSGVQVGVNQSSANYFYTDLAQFDFSHL